MAAFNELIGKTLVRIAIEDDRIDFWTEEGRHYALAHSQDCCESVTVESVIGDVYSLLGSPLLVAEEAESDEMPEGVNLDELSCDDSFTWTFYKLATIKGHVDIRWFGTSNGNYSESVDFFDMAA